MSNRFKPTTNSEPFPCKKYMSKMLKQEASNSVTRAPGPRLNQDKPGTKQTSQPQRPKPKPTVRQQSPIQKITAQMVNNIQKEHINGNNVKEAPKSAKRRPRSRSRSDSNPREVWGELLHSNKSREKMSNFSNFDPLRTVNFLSKELAIRLRNVVPDEGEVLQMVSDIQEALKRVPPEVAEATNSPGDNTHQFQDNSGLYKTKTCQTPPTLYQEDTERFQKIMEENTYRLEASCKQLEVVCANLQHEKELTEKDLEEARDQIEFMHKKMKNLENQLNDDISVAKIKQLQEEKQRLHHQLNITSQEVHDNPTLNHLKKLIEELQTQKSDSDEKCSRLEYDMTLLKMEKEKFVTLLAVRDKEIKEIQDEMCKIQEQVNKQLKKLNNDTLERVNSMRSIPDQFDGMTDHVFLEIGDTTISSIGAESGINVIKETPCGDAKLAGMTQESRDDMLREFQTAQLESANKEADSFENLLTRLSPSIQTMLSSNKV